MNAQVPAPALDPLHSKRWKIRKENDARAVRTRHPPPAASLVAAIMAWTSPLTFSLPVFRWISGWITAFRRLAKPSSDGDVCPEGITLSPAGLLGKRQHPRMKFQDFAPLLPMRRSRERTHASLRRCDLQQRAVSRAHHSLLRSSLWAPVPMFPVTLLPDQPSWSGGSESLLNSRQRKSERREAAQPNRNQRQKPT